ncbi:hypothetical protein GCM10029976_066750 [Kribbella albertanoniae]
MWESQTMVTSDDLLRGIDDIDWGRLRHLEGHADDVPRLLQDLADAGQREREWAFTLLWDRYLRWPGGDDNAGPHTVPFLARIAIAAAAPESRLCALQILQQLAVGHDGRHEDLRVGTDTTTARAEAAADATRSSWPRSYEAVRAELPGLTALLGDPDAAVRARAARLLKWFPGQAATSGPALVAALEAEPDPTVCAAILLTLALIGDRSCAAAVHWQLDAPSQIVRWTAAIASARIITTHTTRHPETGPAGSAVGPGDDEARRVVAVLAQFAADDNYPLHHRVGGPLEWYTAQMLLALAGREELDDLTDDIVTALGDCLRKVDVSLVADLAAEAVILAFGSTPQVAPRAFADLSPVQQHLIVCLGDNAGEGSSSNRHPSHPPYVYEHPEHRPALTRLAAVLADAGLPGLGDPRPRYEPLRLYAGLPLTFWTSRQTG